MIIKLISLFIIVVVLCLAFRLGEVSDERFREIRSYSVWGHVDPRLYKGEMERALRRRSAGVVDEGFCNDSLRYGISLYDWGDNEGAMKFLKFASDRNGKLACEYLVYIALIETGEVAIDLNCLSGEKLEIFRALGANNAELAFSLIDSYIANGFLDTTYSWEDDSWSVLMMLDAANELFGWEVVCALFDKAEAKFEEIRSLVLYDELGVRLPANDFMDYFLCRLYMIEVESAKSVECRAMALSRLYEFVGRSGGEYVSLCEGVGAPIERSVER